MSSAEHEKRLADIRKGSQIEAAWDRKQNKQSIFSSEGSIISTVVVLKSFWHTWWFLFTAFFLCQFLFTAIIVVLSSLPRMKSAPYYVPLIRSDIPTFILRATRDEASLTIGFAQSINALLRRVYGAFDEPSCDPSGQYCAL